MMTAQTVIEAFPTLRRVCHSAALTSFANSEEARIYGLRVFGVHQMDFTVVAGCKPCLGLLSTFPRGNAVTGHCLANDVIIRPNFPFGGSWFSRARPELPLKAWVGAPDCGEIPERYSRSLANRRDIAGDRPAPYAQCKAAFPVGAPLLLCRPTITPVSRHRSSSVIGDAFNLSTTFFRVVE